MRVRLGSEFGFGCEVEFGFWGGVCVSVLGVGSRFEFELDYEF